MSSLLQESPTKVLNPENPEETYLTSVDQMNEKSSIIEKPKSDQHIYIIKDHKIFFDPSLPYQPLPQSVEFGRIVSNIMNALGIKKQDSDIEAKGRKKKSKYDK